MSDRTKNTDFENLLEVLQAVMRSYEAACPERYYGDHNVAAAEDAIKEFIE